MQIFFVEQNFDNYNCSSLCKSSVVCNSKIYVYWSWPVIAWLNYYAQAQLMVTLYKVGMFVILFCIVI